MTRITPSADRGHKAPTKPLSLRCITFNIRYAVGPSGRFENEEAWSVRCPYVCAGLLFNSAVPETFISLQEVLHNQLVDISTGLNGGSSFDGPWAHIGVGREDGKSGGEYESVFYRSDVWELQSHRYLWLSETPDVPSKGWDAGCTRVMSIGEFEHRQSGLNVVAINTHLDKTGTKARTESAKLLLRTIEEYKGSANALILTGDFNSEPDGSAYQIMTAPESSMEDVMHKVPEEKRYGNKMTFTSFGGSDSESIKRIDFIFARKGDNVEGKSYAVLPNKFDDGVHASDHRPVIADLEVSA